MSKNSVHFQNSNFELRTAFHDRSGEAHIDILPKSAFDVQKGLLLFGLDITLGHVYEVEVAHEAQQAHTAGALFGFCSMKQLRVLLLPHGWDASPSQGYPQQYVAGTHFIHLGGERQCGVSFLSKEPTRWPRTTDLQT